MRTRDARKRKQVNKLLTRNELKIKITKINFSCQHGVGRQGAARSHSD